MDQMDALERALTRLAGALASNPRDQRWYGVNCAITVLRAVRDGRDVDEVIRSIVNGKPRADRG